MISDHRFDGRRVKFLPEELKWVAFDMEMVSRRVRYWYLFCSHSGSWDESLASDGI